MSIIHKKIREALGLQFAGETNKANKLRLEVSELVFAYEKRHKLTLKKLGESSIPLTLYEFREQLLLRGWQQRDGGYVKCGETWFVKIVFINGYLSLYEIFDNTDACADTVNEASEIITDYNNLKIFYSVPHKT